jgi:RNA polymerase sigma factor (TIGR02999 family)
MDARHEITDRLLALRSTRESPPYPTAWEELLPLVYDDLRAVAHRQLQRERTDHTLNTTALVHEVYLKLVDQQRATWEDRAHFFAIAARVMRRVLIDYARRHRAAKRDGMREPVPLDVAPEALLGTADERAEVLVALDDALTRLAAVDARLVRVVECRFFGDLTEEETATALGVTARTVRRDWIKAKKWLHRALET